jgi:S-DNA-T family DNA segregation ATPase FtsK/SpoIIIE
MARMEWKKILRSPRFGEIAGVFLGGLAILSLLAIFSYHPDDPSFFRLGGRSSTTENWVGSVGANLAAAAFQLVGLGAFLLPVLLALLCWSAFARRGFDVAWTRLAGSALFLASSSGLFSLILGAYRGFRGGPDLPAGGWIGGSVSGLLAGLLARPGAGVALVTLIGLSIVLSTQFSFSATAGLLRSPLSNLLSKGTVFWARLREDRRRSKMQKEVLKKHEKEQARREAIAKISTAGDPAPAPRTRLAGEAAEKPPASSPTADKTAPPRLNPMRTAQPDAKGASKAASPAPQPEREIVPLPASTPAHGFLLPSTDLLKSPPEGSPINEKELMEKARLIGEKLREFQIGGSVIEIHPGPVVTTYEYKPEPGVKYSRILGLVDDLCLALKAEAIRIDRISGRSTVGIEVPNDTKETIHLRDLVESSRFKSSKSRLTLCLGKTQEGEAFTSDLDKMPHLLIAGSTGSGKSVGLNCMITSILYKSTPDEVRMILIDPKMLELGIYQDLPHLLIPVVTDPKLASNALKWAVREMETRYKLLAGTAVRSIDQYNSLLRREPKRTRRNDRTGTEETLKPLPYIVVVVDELADLMMVASADVELSICRLAQMARAVGIHLILATQRPSVDVITGLIKANLPARIAYRVSQRVDSRTILDANGAEQLLGHGDMLFLPPGSSRLVRLHGAYVSEAETTRIVEFLKEQARPSYDQSVTKDTEDEKSAEFEGERDEMYDKAVNLVVGSGQASISHLQRRLRLGYGRAARIIDMMEAEGIVGPGDGAKPREVLVRPEFLAPAGDEAVE